MLRVVADDGFAGVQRIVEPNDVRLAIAVPEVLRKVSDCVVPGPCHVIDF